MDWLISTLRAIWLYIVAIAKGARAIIYGVLLGLWNNPILIVGIIGTIALSWLLHRIFRHRH